MVAIVAVLALLQLGNAQEQEIIPGNRVNITVLGYPELSKSVLVNRDGTTDYPLLANVPIDGMSISDLKEILMPILTRQIERPRLFINISEYVIMHVRVLGAVQSPGVHSAVAPIDLQGALSLAGGATDEADLRTIKIVRKEGDLNTTINIDLPGSMLSDSAQAGIVEIMDGDLVVVPMLGRNSYVRVLGAVHSPGPYIPMPGENVLDIINRAGGADKDRSLRRVMFFHRQDGRTTSIRLDIRGLIRKGREAEIPIVEPGDVVVVEEYNEYASFAYWAMFMRDISYFLTAIILINRL